MKQTLVVLLLFFVSTCAEAQLTGNTVYPTNKFQQYNKSLLSTGAQSLDGKYKYKDTLNYVERAFTSIAEANAYIPSVQRTSGITVQVNTGGTVNPSTGALTGGYNEDYQYKHGILNSSLQLKVSVSGIFEPKENGNIWFPAYSGSGERLLTITSGGMVNTTNILPPTLTVITQTPGTNNTTPASTAFTQATINAALAASVDTTDVSSAGGGIQIIRSIVNTPQKRWVFRTFVDGTRSTVRLVGDSAIAFDVAGTTFNPAASTDWTGINTFTNSAQPVRIRRTTDGTALQVEGPSGTSQMLFGTDPFFGHNTILSSGRLNVNSDPNASLFLGGKNIMADANINLTRTGISGATNTATQRSSRQLTLESALWNGSANVYSYSGMFNRASTTVNKLSSLVLHLGSEVNPDLNGGSDALELFSDGRARFGMLAKGGPDSLAVIDGSGFLKKVAISLGGGDVYLANNNAMTGLNTFTNAGRSLTVNRSTDGSGLRVAGPGSTNYIDFGTNEAFGFSEIIANGRLNVNANGNYLFLTANTIFAEAPVSISRKSTSNTTNAATQIYSNDLVFENQLWDPTGGVSYKSYNGWQSRASTTTPGLTSMVMRLGSTPNPDLNIATDALEVRTDGMYKFGFFNTGGYDSLALIAGDGTLKKTVRGYGTALQVVFSGNYIVTDSVGSVVLSNISAGTDTLFLPSAALYKNRSINVANIGVGNRRIFPNYTVQPGVPASTFLAAQKTITLQSNGTSWYNVSGGLNPARVGQPTFSVTSGAGTSPSVTMSATSTDGSGTITITTGATGTFGPLVAALTFATDFEVLPLPTTMAGGRNVAAAGLIPGASTINKSSASLFTVNPMVANTPYVFTYITAP